MKTFATSLGLLITLFLLVIVCVGKAQTLPEGKRDFLRQTAKDSKNIIIVCPWAEQFKTLEGGLQEASISCTAVKVIKGKAIKFGQRFNVVSYQETATKTELGALRVLLFDEIKANTIMAETGQFPIFSEEIEKLVSSEN